MYSTHDSIYANVSPMTKDYLYPMISENLDLFESVWNRGYIECSYSGINQKFHHDNNTYQFMVIDLRWV